MRIIRDQVRFEDFLSLLKKRATGSDKEITRIVTEIIDEVKLMGDSALKKYTKRFDNVELESLRLSESKIKESAKNVDESFRKSLLISKERIVRFHENQKEETWMLEKDGAVTGQIIRPLERAGVYVPGGSAAYPSTVLMNVIPAQVAGVKEIALCVPTPGGEINPYVMAAVEMLGIDEVYTIGGAQAVAALAYGTESINKVDKIVGPGNIYVAMAKREVFGEVDIDMIAGPSEILIIADSSSNPSFVAADMLSQAEHDEMASSILITPSEELIHSVKKELERQLRLLKRVDIASKSLDNYGALILSKDIHSAFDYSNLVAPEHLEIMIFDPMSMLHLVKNAGAVFVGEWTPEPLGDYSAGPNHVLPTGGTARFFSPLGVYDFIKRSSLLHFSKEGFFDIAESVKHIADIEGLEAHGNSIRVRLDSFDN